MGTVEGTPAADAQVTTLEGSLRLPGVKSMTMRSWPGAFLLLLLGLVGGWAIARLTPSPQGGDGPNQVLASVGGNDITRSDVEKMAPDRFLGLQRQKEELTEQSLEQAIRVKLVEVEAAARGIAPAQLAKDEVYNKIPQPTEAEIEAIYRQAGTALPRAQAQAQIESMLKKKAQNKRYEEFLTELRQKYPVKERLEPVRAELSSGDYPSKGPKDAPVSIVEYSDFQCPFCQQLRGTLAQVVEAYGDVVRVEYRQFPLKSIHPHAQVAAEASLCANEQGRFWELHDAMFDNPNALATEKLKARARELGIDGPKFDDCLDSKKYAQQVATDLEEGRKLGVAGTPAVFINGRFMGNDNSAEDIAEVILDEMRRAGRPIEARRLNPIRVKVAADGYPAKGPADAPVTIVEFADFQCPYCKQILGPLEEVMKNYGDRVRLVYRQFPIAALHSEAEKAAEASLCAAEQGKFWELHDAMFGDPRVLQVPNLKKMARSLGVEGAKFDSCLDSGKYQGEVARDLETGRSLGVDGTPALFINGRFLSGFQRYETLVAIIEDELANLPK